MYRAAVCDDEERVAGGIRKRVEDFAAKRRLEISVQTYLSAEVLIADLEDCYYDIIFMDVEMPGLDGLQAIHRLRERFPDCLFIVTTAYDQFAIRSIELDVFRYLVKSSMDPYFDIYMDAAIKRLDAMKPENYFIQTARRMEKIACRGILYCYKKAKSCVLVTETGEIEERKTLSMLLQDLQQTCDYFMMIERSYIVNLHHIDKIKGGSLLLDNGTGIPVGQTYMDEVQERIAQFWRVRL